MGQQYNPPIAVNLGKPSNAEQGPRILSTTLVFTSTSITDDLQLESMQNAENNIQSIWVDNNNEGVFTITMLQSNQTLRVGAFTQGFYPLLTNEGTNYKATHDVANASVFLAFYNNPVEYAWWSTGGSVPSAPPAVVSATGANATTTATLPAIAGRTNFLNEVIVQGLGATAGGNATVTISNVVGGPYTVNIAVPTGVGVPLSVPPITFSPPLQATGPNITISAALSAFGAGNTNESITAIGYAQ